jgi:uncharacterized protein YdhG (YjbR/CyaY superfamily)
MKSKKPGYTSIDAYIADFPQAIQTILKELRAVIKSAAPDAEEKISYQMPTFAQEGNLVHFAALKNHIGFYPTPSGIDAFEDELAQYRSTKGAVQFPYGEPLPLEVISKVVKFRVAENLKKAELKALKKKKP